MSNSQLSAIPTDSLRDSQYDPQHSSSYPSLNDSPLWAADYQAPQQPAAHHIPPLLVIQEHHPRIAKVVEMLWGTREMDEYFRQLVIDDRRDRIGFPPEILTAILRLSADHASRFKFHLQEVSTDPWGADPFYRHAFRG
jgi:hypothetical protein